MKREITRPFRLQIFPNEVQSRELSTFELAPAIVSTTVSSSSSFPSSSLAHSHALTREQGETSPTDIPRNSSIPPILTRHHVHPGFSARFNTHGSPIRDPWPTDECHASLPIKPMRIGRDPVLHDSDKSIK